jgi:hypothetical protein
MRLILTLLFLSTFARPAATQVYLQMERYGKAAVTKYAPGTELTYRIKGQREWERAVLERVFPEENRILLGIRYLAPDEIGALRSYHPQNWSRPMANNLYVFAASWTGFALGAALVDRDDPYTAGDALVAATAIGTGFLIRQIFRHRTYRMGEKRRLRIVDLRVNLN